MSAERITQLYDGEGGQCAYCGRRDGHSPRCSVTKFGIPEIRTPNEWAITPTRVQRRCLEAEADRDRYREALQALFDTHLEGSTGDIEAAWENARNLLTNEAGRV